MASSPPVQNDNPPEQTLTSDPLSQTPIYHYLYIIRHGDRYDYANKATWEDLCSSPEENLVVSDPPLSSRGVAQARVVAEIVDREVMFDLSELSNNKTSKSCNVDVLTSPYVRCIQSSQPLLLLPQRSILFNSDSEAEAEQIPKYNWRIEPGLMEYGHIYQTLPSNKYRKSTFPQLSVTNEEFLSMSEAESVLNEDEILMLNGEMWEGDLVIKGKTINKTKTTPSPQDSIRTHAEIKNGRKGLKEKGMDYFRRVIRFSRRLDAELCAKGMERLRRAQVYEENEATADDDDDDEEEQKIEIIESDDEAESKDENASASASDIANVTVMYTHAASLCLVKCLISRHILSDFKTGPTSISTSHSSLDFDLTSIGNLAPCGVFKLRKDLSSPSSAWEIVRYGDTQPIIDAAFGESNPHISPSGANSSNSKLSSNPESPHFSAEYTKNIKTTGTKPWGFSSWHNDFFVNAWKKENEVNSMNSVFVLVDASDWRRVTERPGTKLGDFESKLIGGEGKSMEDKLLGGHSLKGFSNQKNAISYANDRLSEEKGEYLCLRICKLRILRSGGGCVSKIKMVKVVEEMYKRSKEEETEKCGNCGKNGGKLSNCSICKKVKYCCKACQMAAWKVHKKVCKPFVVGETEDEEKIMLSADVYIFEGVKQDHVLSEGWVNRFDNKGSTGEFTGIEF